MLAILASLGNELPDYAILALSALGFALLGVTIAFLSSRLWFRRWPHRSAFEDKLAETAHTSLLGLAAFILALMITNGLSSLAKTEDSARQEGATLYRLDRELDGFGAAAHDAQTALRAYVQNVVDDEWPRLADAPHTLSPLAQRSLDDLWRDLRLLQRGLDPSTPGRADLTRYAERIELLRQSRLAASTSNIPTVFWVILLTFIVATSVIAGRDSSKRFGLHIKLVHMAAIGLAAGLVIVLDNPFRGETSIDSAIIGEALNP